MRQMQKGKSNRNACDGLPTTFVLSTGQTGTHERPMRMRRPIHVDHFYRQRGAKAKDIFVYRQVSIIKSQTELDLIILSILAITT